MKIAYNLMWITPEFPKSQFVANASSPLPKEIENNLVHVASQNSAADVFLWVDSKRLASDQMQYLKQFAERNAKNLKIRDLREISQYRELAIDNNVIKKRFFDIPGKRVASYRRDKNIIWAQVDIARILVTLESLNEGYDQAFYADADISSLKADSEKVQKIITKFGVVLTDGLITEDMIENGMWGFAKEQKNLADKLLHKTLEHIVKSRDPREVEDLNGYLPLNEWGRHVLLPEVKRSIGPNTSLSEMLFYLEGPEVTQDRTLMGRNL